MRRRFTMMAATALFLAGCGGSSDAPSVSQVTVTVRQGTTLLVDKPVVMSSGISSNIPPAPLDPIGAPQLTNASGQAVFTVPSSTSTGSLCFSSSLSTVGSSSFRSQCYSLNSLPAEIPLTH